MMKCKCTFSQRMVGDGCDICNPARALEICRENYAELEAAAKRLVEAAKTFEKIRPTYANGELNDALAEVEALLKVGK